MDSFIFLARLVVILDVEFLILLNKSWSKLVFCGTVHWFCSKTRSTSGRLSPTVNIPTGLWTRWRKDSTGLPDRSVMGATIMPSLLTMTSKTRGTLSYPTHKVFVKVSERSVVGMASKLTSKVAEPSKTFWSPPRTKTQWSTKVVPSIGTNVVT